MDALYCKVFINSNLFAAGERVFTLNLYLVFDLMQTYLLINGTNKRFAREKKLGFVPAPSPRLS
jgi:hypothetical protein